MARRLLLLLLWVLIPAASFAGLPPEQPDEPLFQQSSIAPEDFAGVFERVKLSEPSTEKEFLWLMDALDTASSAEEAAGLLPASVYQQQPDVVALIETGSLPPAQNLTTTGESIPSTPAAGGTLLPGYPGPYGFHTSNPTNNWGMPNSRSGGCGPWFIRGDGLYFDFRRACYQHDLAYRWTPVDRLSVDLRLLREMLYDCSLRSPLTIRLCAIRAGLYFTFVSLLGGPSYGATLTPGYNATGTPMVWPAPYSFCAQASHVWVYTDGYGNRVPRNKSLYFTGVVRQYSRVRYQLIDAYGNVALQHMTHAAQTNCVIHHEQERVSASVLPNGIYQVRALFTPWETEQVTVQNLGSLEIFSPTGSTTCNQNSHAWVYGAQSPITVGAVIYPIGVVRRNTPIYFSFVSQTGGPGYQHTTHAAQNNCVVNHEPEARSTAGWTPDRYDIYATYTEWETDQVVTRPVGVLDLRSSGGGGGGGGDCLRDQCE
ncbi:MAG: Prokaryotic phospholipase [Acidobacteriota bacterium]|nr:Prokaryotic phospholipase [Acidobacteriota bacterium]